jgi:hypothetical protein
MRCVQCSGIYAGKIFFQVSLIPMSLILIFLLPLTDFFQYQHCMAVPWLVTDFSPRRPGFTPRAIHVGFVVEKVALEQGFL